MSAVTREDAISFLETACRNWSKVPKLSEDDIGDVSMALLQFLTARSKPVAGVEVSMMSDFVLVPRQISPEMQDAFIASEGKPTTSIWAAVLAAAKATAPVVSEPERKVMELKMTPIAEGLPVRDEMRGEQTILTYNDRVGAWDISFMETGWDDFDAGFALGVSHWLDITEMWPGVTAQVSSFYTSPQPEAVTEDRLPTREEAAAAAAILLRCNGHDLDVWTDGDSPDDDAWLKTLAALKEA